MNQIANRASSAVAALSSLKSGLQNVASTIVTPGGTPILRMLKDGSWVYGADNVEVETGSLWAVNIMSLEHGYVSWTDKPGNAPNEIVGEVMVPMTSKLPLESELPETGWSWSQQLSVELKCLNGTDVGETVVYKTTSVGGMNAIKSLVAAVMKQLEADPNQPIPIVALENDSYQHKRHGKVYVPMISVEQWSELSDEDPVVDEPVKEEKPAAPARQRAAAAANPKPAAKAEAKQESVKVTAADQKAALMAQLAALEEEETEGEEAPVEEVADEEAQVADAPRRRRRA